MATRRCAAQFLLPIWESTIELGDRNFFKYRNNYEISKIYRLHPANGQVMHQPDAQPTHCSEMSKFFGNIETGTGSPTGSIKSKKHQNRAQRPFSAFLKPILATGMVFGFNEATGR
jgi:hypothetical protein